MCPLHKYYVKGTPLLMANYLHDCVGGSAGTGPHTPHLVPLRHRQIFYLASDAVEGQPVVVPLLSAQ